MTLLKKNKAKTNRELETLGRRHLKDVRVVVKNMVYVVGMGVGQEGRAEEVGTAAREGHWSVGPGGRAGASLLWPALPTPSLVSHP